MDILHFKEKYFMTKPFFKALVGHEVMHQAQYNTFTDLIKRESELYKTNINPEESPLRKLIEGDACFIERKIIKKYSIPFWLISSVESSSDYSLWANILQKKFNGNRKDINELYTAPVEELVKIFGGNK
jgi:hypothetical protein